MSNMTGEQRNELARTLMDASAYAGQKCGSLHWPNMADMVLAAGYCKPRTLGYVVVDQRNTPLEANFRSREDAEDYARENTERMSHAYRVVQIVEIEQ